MSEKLNSSKFLDRFSLRSDKFVRNEYPLVAGEDGGYSDALLELPQPKKSFFIAAVATLFLATFVSILLPSVGGQFLAHLPMQLIWTSCLLRLTSSMQKLYGKAPRPAVIVALSFVSFIFMPLFQSALLSFRWLDPSFWCWVAGQCLVTWLLGRYLEMGITGKKSKALAAELPWKLTIMGNGYLLLGLFFPFIFSTAPLFGFLWFISQYSVISYVTKSLKSKVTASSNSVSNKVSARDKAFIAGEEVLIPYRVWPAVERWFSQRFEQREINKGIKWLCLGILAPVLLFFGVSFVLYFFNQGLSAAADKAVIDAAAIAASRTYLAFLFSGLAGVLGISWLAYLNQPSHIALSSKGIKFLWRRQFLKRDGVMHLWKNMAHISLRHPSGKTSTLHDKLCLTGTDNRNMEIKLDSMDSFIDKELILKAIKTWAPAVSRDAGVLTALEPPADYSYTEMWLQALSAPPKREKLKPLTPESRVKDGQYKVLRSLGVGGQGQAYLADEVIGGATVVLKEFILPVYVDIGVRKSALEQFENEARILQHLEHPQIVKLLDYFIEDHRAYLVLEHIKGQSLREYVQKNGPLSEEKVRELAAQMCSILSYLHGLSPPVVHRDFTPDNLILRFDGTLKLIDFNVARQQESTTSGTVVGKHAYLPIEQFRGMPTTQSDIYAMGATLFYLLTGADPEPISVSNPQRLNPSISDTLSEIVREATALEPRVRYADIDKLERDLYK